MNEYTLEWLSGDHVIAVEVEEVGSWTWKFASGGKLQLYCPWRVLENEAIRISSEDHKQQYGLPAPIDAATEVASLLRGDIVTVANVAQKSGDIRIAFESGKELQAVPFSSGDEAWESLSPRGFNVIAQGGQQLAGFQLKP